MLKRTEEVPEELIADGIRMRVMARLDTVSLDYITVSPNSVEHEISHRRTDELIFVLQGELCGAINGEKVHLSKGTCISIPRGTRHKFYNESSDPVVLLAVCSPPYDKNDVHLHN
jgi:mannose-6-phosphate isomerase-like protein (cupin superfamily)